MNGDPDSAITNTFQLIGKFLSLKGSVEGGGLIGSVEHMERFWFFLEGRGVHSHRSAIVLAIAEKVNTMSKCFFFAIYYIYCRRLLPRRTLNQHDIKE